MGNSQRLEGLTRVGITVSSSSSSHNNNSNRSRIRSRMLNMGKAGTTMKEDRVEAAAAGEIKDGRRAVAVAVGGVEVAAKDLVVNENHAVSLQQEGEH